MKVLKWIEAQEIIKKNSIIYLWFGTDWCGDCQMMLPIIEEVEKELLNKNISIPFIKVDAQESNLFRKDSIYKVKKIPTHVFIKNGNIKNILYEYIPKEIILNEIEKIINA